MTTLLSALAWLGLCGLAAWALTRRRRRAGREAGFLDHEDDWGM